MSPLLAPVPGGYPAFMQGQAYAHLRLNTYLASYAQLKHDTLLYAKQALAEMGGPGFVDTEVEVDDRGYVIPELALYRRVGTLLDLLSAGMSARGLMPQEVLQPYTRFQRLVGGLAYISQMELQGVALSRKDYELIRYIGGDLEHFWEATLIEPGTTDRWFLLDENNPRIITSIFSGPGRVQHVASGYVHPVYVAFPRDGKLAIGRGGVLSFYEVDSPTALSDSAWRKALDASPPPAPPEWTSHFRAYDPQGKFERYDSVSDAD